MRLQQKNVIFSLVKLLTLI